MKIAIVVATALVAGFLAGQWSRPGWMSRAERAADHRAERGGDDQTGRADDDGDDAPFADPAAIDPALASRSVSEQARRVEQLEAEVRRLNQRVARHDAFQQGLEGARVAFPADRSADADQQQLLDALQESFRRRGIDGEVSAVDCGEFPCIAHGVVRGGDAGDVRTLARDAQGVIGGAPWLAIAAGNDAGGKSRVLFSIACHPSGLPPPELDNLNKRLTLRRNGYLEASAQD